MSRILKNIFFFWIFAGSLSAAAQTTTSSTYSQLGPGLLNRSLLPQSRAMGGISAGLRKPGAYNNVNLANPASYSAIQLTTFDAGISGEILDRSKGGVSEGDFTGSLSHLVFGIPVTKTSALSFGILPYSSLGYQTRVRGALDTSMVDHLYSGDGGLSKAYFGYGIQLGKHFSIGANASYIFGKLERSSSLEFVNDFSAFNTRQQSSSSVGGFNFDYGLQYTGNLSKNTRLVLGYAGTASSKLDLDESTVFTRYIKGAGGEEEVAADTAYQYSSATKTLKTPIMHTVGFTVEKVNKWLLGADLRLGQWDNYREGNENPGEIQNSYGISVGGQITPDINSVGSYLKVMDYRLGFAYDKTNMRINNTDIKQMAVTLGFGFPLQASPTRTTFYKINVAAELGQRGTESNSLVRERYINFHLGFTLNDQWFRRYKFD
ncbi:hypothetical protein [Arcticibacter tournemirensis]|uniref:Aromatic hydrocarbon degradation protein n=1 Tax=Arcticibacter tournemirensis TaxID=699437 RepID=A0A4Q0MEE1_9SPHI|nr:hypothetical protein [Arcticibacter tournemirensis]RXF71604.1 hypothetical protein EKH83_02650 [Arcticibacter tournemirensis]